MPPKSFQRVFFSSILLTMLASKSAMLGAVSIDFNGLAVGTKLDKQFTGVTFLKYQGRVGGVIVDSPSGHVASFNDCYACEFFSAGANIAFSTLQRTVTLQVGLLPIQGVTIQRDLRLTAFDAAGTLQVTALANITAGAGFGTTLTVTTTAPQIASVVLEAVNDPEMLAQIAIHDIIYESAPPGSGPDFALDGPPGETVVQGSAPIDVPLNIRRIGGSTGDISFSLSQLPAGVSASVFPNPASASSVMLRLQATIGPAPELKTVVITGAPVVSSAGPASRTLSIDISTVPKLRVSGPADIDFANSAPNGAHGVITRDYWVIRHHSVSGPLNVTLEGLPPDVTGTVDPKILPFSGGAIGQRVSVTLTTIAGLPVPDTWAPLHITGPGVGMSFPILLHGEFPQQNRNFVIRGQFSFVNAETAAAQEGAGLKGPQPLKGAQVEIFRYRPNGPDDRVDETYTDDQGRFSRDIYASTAGDYYARLRLFSPEVQLEDADNSSVWSIDTKHQLNLGGLIDVGTIVISKDNGNGTPRAAVWQGFRDAALEFQNTTGQPVPGGSFLVEVWRGHLTPLVFYDEVHWAHGYRTGESGRPYRVTTHEFAHVFRDRFDGSESHWHWDNLLYVYGRRHSVCQILCGTQANAGFGFHEGWADYWSNSFDCCPNDIDNQNIEGTVATDLNNLANKLSTNSKDSRKKLVQVLASGTNLIHSQDEFRREYAAQFPTVPLGNIGDGGCASGLPSDCLQLTNLNRTRPWYAAASTLSSRLSLTDPRPRNPIFALDAVEQRKRLVTAINSREKAVTDLMEQRRSSSGLRAFMLRAAVEEATLVVQRMRDELAELDRGGPTERYLQRAFFERRQRTEFVAQRRAIQMRALRDALAVISAEQRPAVERRIRLLQESRIEDASLESMLLLPAVVGDDTIVAATSSHLRWLLLAMLMLTLAVVVLLIVFFHRKRSGSAGYKELINLSF